MTFRQVNIHFHMYPCNHIRKSHQKHSTMAAAMVRLCHVCMFFDVVVVIRMCHVPGVGIQTWSIVLLCKERDRKKTTQHNTTTSSAFMYLLISSVICVCSGWLCTARSIYMQRVNNNTENLYHVVCTFIEMNGWVLQQNLQNNHQQQQHQQQHQQQQR